MGLQDLDRIRFVTRHFDDLQGLGYWVPLGLITLSWGVLASHFASRLLAGSLYLAAILLIFGARRYYRTTFGEVERPPAAVDLYPVPIFSPAGPAPRLEGFHPLPPAARHFLTTLGLAVALFSVLLAFTPNVELDSAPWLTLEGVGVYGPHFRNWKIWNPIAYDAIFAQMTCLLYGAFFLSLWLWRERRPSQRHYLGLGAGLLGLTAFGAFLGYLVGEHAEPVVRIINFFLPAVVHPRVALFLCGSLMILAGLFDHWQLVRALGRPHFQEQSEEHT
jgi:hypothetical protein